MKGINMFDFIEENLGWFMVGIISLVISVFVWVYTAQQSSWEKGLVEINQMYGFDKSDVSVFLNKIGADTDDFLASKGIRKQYELFTEGKSSDFIKAAEAHKNAESAQSMANTAMAISAAAMANSVGRR